LKHIGKEEEIWKSLESKLFLLCFISEMCVFLINWIPQRNKFNLETEQMFWLSTIPFPVMRVGDFYCRLVKGPYIAFRSILHKVFTRDSFKHSRANFNIILLLFWDRSASRVFQQDSSLFTGWKRKIKLKILINWIFKSFI
jgi:hypothetical protein